MDNLYIVGAGGLGREVLNFILDIRAACGDKWEVRGFLDDTENPLRGIPCDFSVVGTIRDFQPKKNDLLVMGIASPEAKKNLSAMLKNRGGKFETFIFPGSYIGRHCVLGEGCIVYGGCGMTVNVNVGNFATILGTGIGHDTRIGNFCTISAYTHIMGKVSIGNEVFIGANAAIGPGISIGDGAYVCMGSMVMKDLSPHAKCIGNPAREIA